MITGHFEKTDSKRLRQLWRADSEEERRRISNRSFTLIEMLVVIAVMTVFTSLMLPSLQTRPCLEFYAARSNRLIMPNCTIA